MHVERVLRRCQNSADPVAAPEQDLGTKNIDAERIRRASRDLSYWDGKSFPTIRPLCETVDDFVDASVAREHNDGVVLEFQISWQWMSYGPGVPYLFSCQYMYVETRK
jgi:hypothetical protein